MIGRDDSVIVTTFARLVVPLAQLFGLYVLLHGHESPGGGFQAGVILGATYILLALALGPEATRRMVDEPACLALAAGGVLLYLLTGLLPMAGGGTFLDYAALPLGRPAPASRWLGILLIETGVTLGVAATLVLIFSRLAERPR